MTKVLITGANGLLGQKLVQLYGGKRDTEVIATGIKGNRNLAGSYTYVTMDITSEKEVNNVITHNQPDIVIHTAALVHTDKCELHPNTCWKMNVTAVEYLVTACKKVGSFFIQLSSDFIFDGKNGPYKEEDLPNPLSKYGKSKLASEELLHSSGLDHAIVRTTLIYGLAHKMSRSNIVIWTKQTLEKKTPIKMINDQWRTPTLAEDLAKGCYLIAERKAKGIFHISGKESLTPYDIAIKTADFFNLDKSLIEKINSSSFIQPAKRPKKTEFILDKAKRELGYDPASFKESLAILKSQFSYA